MLNACSFSLAIASSFWSCFFCLSMLSRFLSVRISSRCSSLSSRALTCFSADFWLSLSIFAPTLRTDSTAFFPPCSTPPERPSIVISPIHRNTFDGELILNPPSTVPIISSTMFFIFVKSPGFAPSAPVPIASVTFPPTFSNSILAASACSSAVFTISSVTPSTPS